MPTAGPYAGAEAVVDVAAGPRGVAYSGGSIWVASTIDGRIQRVDPTDATVMVEIQVDRPVTMLTLGDQLWASVLNADPSSDDEVVRIDTDTNEIDLRVDVPVFHNIAASAGAIWAMDGEGTLRRVDAASGEVSSLGSVGGVTVGIAANGDAVWGIREDGVAWRLPLDGGALLEVELDADVPGRSRVAVGAGRVWVAVPGSVLALDPDDLSMLAELSLPGMELVNDLYVTGTDIWISANLTDADRGLAGGAVLRLEPETAEVTATFRLGPESSGVIEVDGSVWAVDQRDNVLVRYTVP